MTNLLLWLDLETTGLDPDTDQILEIACILTGEDLAPIRSWSTVIKPRNPLTMIPFVAAMHAKNRLLEEVNASKDDVSDAEGQCLAQLVNFNAADTTITIAGATVHFDKSFLRVHMPDLHERLHYRTFDVSTLKAAARMWCCKLPDTSTDKHRAIADTQEALDVARTFMKAFLSAGADFANTLRGEPTASEMCAPTEAL